MGAVMLGVGNRSVKEKLDGRKRDFRTYRFDTTDKQEGEVFANSIARYRAYSCEEMVGNPIVTAFNKLAR